VLDAAARAGADEFIRALPDGYATIIGDGGRALSPGERRRVGLARAFLRDAPLVILDEPTADLDPRSVAIVASAVRRLQTGRTMLLIAHRPELVEHMDRVVRLDQGSAVPAERRGPAVPEARTAGEPGQPKVPA
jgi:ABC-type multidrug transport system fused ATPase/permease subunit